MPDRRYDNRPLGRRTGRPDRSATRRRCAPAFTLIEVLIVVVVLGIAGSIVVPSMLGGGTLTIQGAARRIVSDVLVAQNEAIARQEPRRIVFNVDGNSYRVQERDEDQPGRPWVTVESPWTSGSYVVEFGSDGRFSSVSLDKADFAGDAHLVFDAMGSPSVGGNVNISADGKRYRVNIVPFTGRVSVEPIEGAG